MRSEAARTTPKASQTVARGAHAHRSKVLATPHPWKTCTQELHTEGVPDGLGLGGRGQTFVFLRTLEAAESAELMAFGSASSREIGT